MFARHYTDFNNKDTFGNAYRSMLASRDWNGNPQNGMTYASKLRKKPEIQKRIEELLDLRGLNDTDVDLERLKIIKQDRDLTNKNRAIEAYDKLKGRGGTTSVVPVINIIDFSNVQPNKIDNSAVVREVRPEQEAISDRNIIEQSSE